MIVTICYDHQSTESAINYLSQEFQTASTGLVSLLFVQNCISFDLYIYPPDWKENDKRAILSASNLARTTSGNDKY